MEPTTSTTARDELAAVIVAAYGEDAEALCPCVQDLEVAEKILAAGYRKARTISTSDELGALPVGSVVMDADSYVGRKERDTGGAEWSVSLHKYSKESRAFALPATVLWEPTP